MSIRGGSSSTTTTLGNSIFNNAPFWKSSGIFLGANTLGYAINWFFPHMHYHVDLLGTGAFAAAAASGLSSDLTRIRWSSAAVTAWSVKLAAFLLYRISHTQKDMRLDAQLSNPTDAAVFWAFSALWGLVCSLPHALGTTSSLAGSPLALRCGAALFGAGWLTETAADYQKWMFKQNHLSGQFCNVGLWSVSQHPNWWGNLMLWTGILVMNAPALVEPATAKGAATTIWRKLWSYRRLALAFVGPVFMWTLFDAQATGKILNDSLQSNLKKYGYGEDPVFTKYIDNTPLILPNPFKMFFRSESS